MADEIRNLVSDIKEQLIYLHELGVEAIEVKLSETVLSESVGPGPTTTASPPPEELKIQIESASRKTNARSRLSSLPSLTKRAVSPKPVEADGTPAREPVSSTLQRESPQAE